MLPSTPCKFIQVVPRKFHQRAQNKPVWKLIANHRAAGAGRASAKSRFVPFVLRPHVMGRYMAALVQAGRQIQEVSGMLGTFCADRDFAGALVGLLTQLRFLTIL